MDTFLAITAILCGIVGILGAVLPILPGTIISFVGMFCAYFTSDSEISAGQMWLWGIISAIIILLDYILPGYFSKLMGGTRAGITGATVGVFVGLTYIAVKIAQFIKWLFSFQWWVYVIVGSVFIGLVVFVYYIRI